MNGKKFTRLTVVADGPRKQYKTTSLATHVCKCDCGNVVTVIRSNLLRGATKSCGCLKKETAGLSSKTHGQSQSDEYRIWAGIRNRCYNKNCAEFKYWGGKGVRMSKEWEASFETFFRDMGKRPTKKHSIDRINSNGDYCKQNCRWATAIEQGFNTSRTRLRIVSPLGEQTSLRQFAKLHKISYYTAYDQLARRRLPFSSFLSAHALLPKCQGYRFVQRTNPK